MHLHRTVHIAAPPETVWRCLTDAKLRPRWLRHLVSEEVDGPDRRGVGSAATVRLRQNGQVVTYRTTVEEFDVGRRLGVGMNGGNLPPDAVLGVRYDLSPGDATDTTTLDYQMHFPITTWRLKVFWPLICIGAARATDDALALLTGLAESLTNSAEED